MSYHVIRDGSAVPSAVVNVVRESAKAFTRDLAWVPADLPGATAEECGYEDFEQYLYAIARHAREELQRTEWRGEYEYFVHLESASCADTLKPPEALVRCREGVRERLGADGTWRAAEDPPGTVSLPVTEAEHDRLRWRVAAPQWSVARDDLSYPVAVVRRIPAFAEAYTRNLRWEPVPPGLRLEEIRESQAGDLLFALTTGVRQARRTGTVEYFGILPGRSTSIDLDDVFSVVRRDNGVEEVYVRDGLWVRSDRLRDDWHRNLPLGAEEVERITARLPRSRCFLVDDGRAFPRAVVHLDDGTERAFGRDLAWTASGLLAEVAEHPYWTVEEADPDTEVTHAFLLARRVRQFKQRHVWQGAAYHGVFRTCADGLDVRRAHTLIRGSHSMEAERYTGGGRWEPTTLLRSLETGGWSDEELPVSWEEAEMIMKLLD
ncbi:hypothetical protein ACIOD2_48755 [Amycolatopsis sp. NPDC088138]|uniref:hypothetical protein n=1 Tax=Amycolatopsis sp. NPDC088138 TaxID=3363938 RepID=UPI00380F0C94